LNRILPSVTVSALWWDRHTKHVSVLLLIKGVLVAFHSQLIPVICACSRPSRTLRNVWAHRTSGNKTKDCLHICCNSLRDPCPTLKASYSIETSSQFDLKKLASPLLYLLLGSFFRRSSARPHVCSPTPSLIAMSCRQLGGVHSPTRRMSPLKYWFLAFAVCVQVRICSAQLIDYGMLDQADMVTRKRSDSMALDGGSVSPRTSTLVENEKRTLPLKITLVPLALPPADRDIADILNGKDGEFSCISASAMHAYRSLHHAICMTCHDAFLELEQKCLHRNMLIQKTIH